MKCDCARVEELWLQYTKGNLEAFTELYTHVHSLFSATIYRIVRDPQVVEDLLQEAMYRIYRFRANAYTPVYPWLYTVVRNVAYQHLRDQRRVPAICDNIIDDPNVFFEPGFCAEPLAKTITMRNFLQKLSREDRIMLVGNKIYGYTHKETGEMVGKTALAAKTRCHRVAKRIRQQHGPVA